MSGTVRAIRKLAALLLVAALSPALAQGAAPKVVVSIHPLYDLVRRVAGPDAEVTRLLPPGVSTHTYDPRPSDLRTITAADLMIINGGLDLWATKLLSASGSGAALLEVLALPEVQAEAVTRFPDLVRTDAAGAVTVMNTHVWLTPTLMMAALPGITGALTSLAPAHAAGFEARAAALETQLGELHEQLQELLAPVEGAAFVPFHDAWPYFAAEYSLDLIVEIEPYPGREPSPAYLRYALELILESGAKAIFSEVQLSRRPAEVLAAEANVALYELDPKGGVAGRDTYEQLLLFNAAVLAEALQGP
ncbi:MAG: metal ABC transporter substrate-binding protein [Trueperaceae bacterium]